ncbi:MAG TPA: RNA polymerase sigma factor [Acidimicrobiales bacterium]|nr:RNA polymerase sigma factor [Acidimicrobiales bacterium]
MGERHRRAGGESEGLQLWLASYYDSAYRTAFLMLGDRHDAEEAVQDAFLRAWRFRAALPGGTAFRPWLYRVVVNSCLSLLRSQRTRRIRSSPFDDVLLERRQSSEDGYGQPETQVEVLDTRAAVVAAVSALPEHLRAVIVLRFFAGLSEREIAQAIKRRPGTVKSRLHEAKVRLSHDPRLGGFQDIGVAEEAGND